MSQDKPTSEQNQTNEPTVSLERQEILDLIKEIGEQERHFNTLTGTYKAMASTWLLAVFGGIGFVLANKIEPWLLYTAGIGIAGSMGILLLWIIDLRVYQQLLNAAFVEGQQLEYKHRWLPPIRKGMEESVKTGSVTTNISWFYVLGVCAPLLIFDFCIGSYLLIHFDIAFPIVFMLVVGFATLLLAYKIRFQSKEKRSEERARTDQNAQIENKKIAVSDKLIMFAFGSVLYLMVCTLIYANVTTKAENDSVKTISLKANYEHLAPDGSEIRLLATMTRGSLAHCVLPPQGISSAVQHRSVDEIWYVLQGSGEIWREHNRVSSITKISSGVSITIPVHTKFQFRNT
ncbi:MAG: cupin domain-containing protein, partial [Bacteroidota bacterium]